MKYFLIFFSLLVASCNNSKNISNSSKDVNLVGNYEVISMSEIENISNKNITINFSADGKVNGNNSCNNYGGSYKVDDNKLSFGMMMSTKMFCQENTEIETIFMQNLSDVDGFKIHKDVLILLKRNTPIIEAKKVLKKE